MSVTGRSRGTWYGVVSASPLVAIVLLSQTLRKRHEPLEREHGFLGRPRWLMPFGTYRGCARGRTNVACRLGEWASAAVGPKHADDAFHELEHIGVT